MPSAYDEEIKMWEKWQQKDPRIHRDFTDWRRTWKAKGPVEFTKDVLKIDPNTGQQIQLSDDQKEFLNDIGKGKVRLAIIVAGRGAGKTFVLAVYIIWRIATHEFWGISTMGGSAEQSEKIWFYISRWIQNSKILKTYFLKPTKKKVSTYAGSYVSFHSCSVTSVRGPHTYELIIDEQAAGEERGKTKTIKAAIFQVSTSPDIHIIKSSTAQYIHGDFLHTWNEGEKLGYKKYCWSIARHVSGEKDIYKIYKDTNPMNWLSNVPWIPDLNIRILRDGRSNDEWLVEALGGISKASGLVFSPDDLEACVCRYCPEELGRPCQPYQEGYCPIVQMIMQLEGVKSERIPKSTKKALQKVTQRIEGIDWGKKSPCAYTALGKFKRIAFVLFSDEVVGLTDDEKIQMGVDVADRWNIEIIRPDPREWSFNNELSDRGFAIHELFGIEGGQEKNTYLHTVKKFVERHHLIVPCAYESLIRSMRNLTYDDDGKIRKVDDHSFDSLLYGISFYGEIDDQSAFWEAMKKAKKGKTETDISEKSKHVTKTDDPDVKIIDDWEGWLKEKKWEKEESDDEDEFPWGEGVEMW